MHDCVPPNDCTHGNWICAQAFCSVTGLKMWVGSREASEYHQLCNALYFSCWHVIKKLSHDLFLGQKVNNKKLHSLYQDVFSGNNNKKIISCKMLFRFQVEKDSTESSAFVAVYSGLYAEVFLEIFSDISLVICSRTSSGVYWATLWFFLLKHFRSRKAKNLNLSTMIGW